MMCLWFIYLKEFKFNYVLNFHLIVVFKANVGSSVALITGDYWVVVVAQLVDRSLLTPEVCRSNPVIGKLLY